MHYYKEAWIDQLKKHIKNNRLKIKDFRFFEHASMVDEVPQLTIMYTPKSFQFKAGFNTSVQRYEFEFTPGDHSKRPTVVQSIFKGAKFEMIEICFYHWLRNVYEEVNAGQVKDDDEKIEDEKIQEAKFILEFPAIESPDRLITWKEQEKILQGLVVFVDHVSGLSISSLELENIKREVEQVKEEIKKPNLTRNKLRGLLQRFVETTVFAMIIDPNIRQNVFGYFVVIFKPIWEKITALAEHYAR